MPGKIPRYYREIAINRAIKAILQGEKRVLLTLATGIWSICRLSS